MRLGLNVEVGMSTVKMMDLNTEMFAEKIMTGLVLEIDSNSIHTEMALIE